MPRADTLSRPRTINRTRCIRLQRKCGRAPVAKDRPTAHQLRNRDSGYHVYQDPTKAFQFPGVNKVNQDSVCPERQHCRLNHMRDTSAAVFDVSDNPKRWWNRNGNTGQVFDSTPLGYEHAGCRPNREQQIVQSRHGTRRKRRKGSGFQRIHSASASIWDTALHASKLKLGPILTTIHRTAD